MLFDSGKLELAEPIELHANERKKIAEDDFEYWLKGANGFMKMFTHAVEQDELNIAAFLLHQTVEKLYGTILLVFTRYKPSTHDLEKLGSRVASVEIEFLRVFPQGTEQEKARFELLRKAYVSARYNPSFVITAEELEWLAGRVKCLQELTEKLCKAKIESFAV
ncbi:hypothetical protein MNBD_GAMMA03-1557 [hydrothermal vent metagenome]|uniref:HEPN domain-containing protein n=1 Tax=hydrothermal vent metagenome TaxID=652676 RepID=A0A3B0WE11_9ZZZZ